MSFVVHGAPGLESFMADNVGAYCGLEPAQMKCALEHSIAEDCEVLHAGEGKHHYRQGQSLTSKLSCAIGTMARSAKPKQKCVFGDSAENSQRLAYFLEAVGSSVEYDRAVVVAGAKASEAVKCQSKSSKHCTMCPDAKESDKREDGFATKCPEEGSAPGVVGSYGGKECCEGCSCCCCCPCCGDSKSGKCSTKGGESCGVQCSCCGSSCKIGFLKSFRGPAPSGYPLDLNGLKCAASPLSELDLSRKNKYLADSTYLYGEECSVGDVTFISRVCFHMYMCASGAVSATKGQISDVLRFPQTPKDLKTLYPCIFRLANTLSKMPKMDEFINLKGELPKAFGKHAPASDPSSGDTGFGWDEFKRIFSNTKDIKGEVMPYIKKNFNPHKMTIYKMTYEKMEGELTKMFVACNHMKGFMQRFRPAFSKQSFARLYVVGEEPNIDIVGLWIVEGTAQRLPDGITEHPSWEFYTWESVDISQEDLIYDFLKGGDSVVGRTINERYDFK